MVVRLIERYLTEDIDAVKNHPQFKDIPSDVFDEIIETDPTFKPSSNSVGKYGKWLLSLYKKDGLFKSFFNSDNEQMKGEFIRNIKKTIDKYEEYKNDRTKVIEKDIMKFKSVQDMANAIKNVGEAELSDKQKQRQAKKDKPYDLVFSGDVYDVYIPRNHEGDMVLASFGGSKKATWCTAADSDQGRDRYDNYLRAGGKYYVLINRSNYDDKYQFHFESGQFQDAYQVNIHCLNEVLDRDDKLYGFFVGEGYEDELPAKKNFVEVPSRCIKYATLPTKEQIEQVIPKEDRLCNNQPGNEGQRGDPYWLKTAGKKRSNVFIVMRNGEIAEVSILPNYRGDILVCGIRPVLVLSEMSNNCQIGDYFRLGESIFKIVSNNLAICTKVIGGSKFRRNADRDIDAPDANDYEQSDVKKYVDNWFNRAYSAYKDDTPKTESYRRIHMREI